MCFRIIPRGTDVPGRIVRRFISMHGESRGGYPLLLSVNHISYLYVAHEVPVEAK